MDEISALLMPDTDRSAAAVPLARRGVQVKWLVQLGRAFGYSNVSTNEFIRNFVLPNTAADRIPLFARVPARYRGRPKRFISHAWNDRFYATHGFGLIAVMEYRLDPEEFVWIDFACHNQHKIEQVPKDLHRSISAIGAVDFCIDKPILLTRSWCVYELLTSHLVHAQMRMHMAGGHRVDQHARIQDAVDSFTSLREAESTTREDKQAIDAGVLETFRSFDEADERVRTLLEKTLSDFRKQMNAIQMLERGTAAEKSEAKEILIALSKQRRRSDRIAKARRMLWKVTGL